MFPRRPASIVLFLAAYFLLLAAQPSPGLAQPPKQVKWVKLSEPAGDLLNKEQLVVIYFSAGWCHWCEKLDKEVLSSPEFNALADRALFMKTEEDTETDPSGKQLQEALKIESYPIMVVLKTSKDNKSTEVGRVVGHHEKSKFLMLLRPLLGLPAEDVPATSLVGGGLGPSANLCPPGDIGCLLRSELFKPTLPPFDQLPDVPAETPVPQTAKPISHSDVERMLREAGYSPTANDVQGSEVAKYFDVADEREGYKFGVRLALSNDNARLWAHVTLANNLDVDQIPVTTYVQLLRHSLTYGPCQFVLNENSLVLMTSLENSGITANSLKSAITSLETTTIATASTWGSLQKPATP